MIAKSYSCIIIREEVINIDIQDIKLDKDYVASVIKNIGYNKQIVSYYEQLCNEFIGESKEMYQKLDRKLKALEECNSFWEIDKYYINKIKDFKRTNLCKDKFCSNCKKVKQASRMSRFIPQLEKYKDKLYHMTLTQPNVGKEQVKATIKKCFKGISKLIRYLNGTKKIRGIDFSEWQYEGAVRSLEITFQHNSYHVHLHVALVLNCDDIINKKCINTYSYHYGVLKRLFSEKEILIQKIWYLIMNDIKVTKKAIDSLELGYSCTIDKFTDDSYAELFKYMIKDFTETHQFMTYENFKTLYFSLLNVRQIQGYGCLFNITDDDISEEVDELYNSIIEELQKKETPVEAVESPHDILNDTEYMLISRKKIFKYLRKL